MDIFSYKYIRGGLRRGEFLPASIGALVGIPQVRARVPYGQSPPTVALKSDFSAIFDAHNI